VVPVSGASLAVVVSSNVEAGDEDIAFDDLEVLGFVGGPIDTGVVDTGTVDTGTVDTGAVDTGTVDTGAVDTGVVDTGTVDTGVAGDLLLAEPFDSDAAFAKADGNGAAATFFSDGFSDYFGISDGATGGDFDGATPPDLTGFYTGFDGQFLAMQDLDGDGFVPPAAVSWSGIDVSGYGGIEVSLSLAEALAVDGNNDIDANEFVRIEAIVDGGAPVIVAEFRSDIATNGVFREDTDGDGVGDGPVALGPAAQRFTWPVSATGSVLDVVITASVEAGDEDLALDDLVVIGVR
jgi:hypothetical protein